MKNPIRYIFLFCMVCGIACQPVRQEGTRPINHSDFDALLKKHVAENGGVDYEGMMTDTAQLNRYCHKLSSHVPNDKNWSREEQLAYWINAYNAFTLQLVLQHHPVHSIKNIKKGLAIPFINSVWDIDFIPLGDKEKSLNFIEHTVLRHVFEEPRIHFAIVCASVGCPALRNEAYTADALEAQLEEQAYRFINESHKNRYGKDYAKLSKIFQWFGSDFKTDGELWEYINRYVEQPLTKDTHIEHLPYDWRLNSTENMHAL